MKLRDYEIDRRINRVNVLHVLVTNVLCSLKFVYCFDSLFNIESFMVEIPQNNKHENNGARERLTASSHGNISTQAFS